MKDHLNKGQWIQLFHQIGMNEQQMKFWHQIFEKTHPLAHASFLSWLGLSQDEIQKIRTDSSN